MTHEELNDLANSLSNKDLCELVFKLSERFLVNYETTTKDGQPYGKTYKIEWVNLNGPYIDIHLDREDDDDI
jgi:hypothetical protein